MTTTSLQVLDAEFERAERLRAAWQLDAAEDAYRALLSDATLRPRLLTEIAVTPTDSGKVARAGRPGAVSRPARSLRHTLRADARGTVQASAATR